jgi:hypothetical protein
MYGYPETRTRSKPTVPTYGSSLGSTGLSGARRESGANARISNPISGEGYAAKRKVSYGIANEELKTATTYGRPPIRDENSGYTSSIMSKSHKLSSGGSSIIGSNSTSSYSGYGISKN